MESMSELLLSWGMGVSPVCMLVGVAVARSRFHAPHDWLGRLLFFACLTLVGGVTLLAMALNSNLWLLGGTNLSIMAVGSTLEAGRTHHAPAC